LIRKSIEINTIIGLLFYFMCAYVIWTWRK